MSVVEVQEQAFDTSPWELPRPTIDGHKADRLVVSFAGVVELDRTNQTHIDFIESLLFGDEVTLGTIGATVVKKGFSDPQAVTYGIGLRIHTLSISGGE